MIDEVLAENIAAHWFQAGVLATSALIADAAAQPERAAREIGCSTPRADRALPFLPLVQPWRTDEPALQMSPAATTEAAVAAISAETARRQRAGGRVMDRPEPRCRGDPRGWHSHATAVAVRTGVLRLARFSRQGTGRLAPRCRWRSPGSAAGVAALHPADRQSWPMDLRICSEPTVALPAGFDALVPAFQRAIICHELLHVKRRDMAVAFVEELAVAALWFHPWIWLLRARIRVAREQVVDGRVVTMLGNRDEYVRCLVDISGHDLAPHFSQAGAGMLRPRELRARVDAIFQEARMSGRQLVVVTLALMMAVGATTYIAAAALPMRSPAIVDRASAGRRPACRRHRPLVTNVSAQTGSGRPMRSPINLQFRERQAS